MWKMFNWNLSKFLKKKNSNTHSLGHDTQNGAQTHSVSTDHAWFISSTRLESTCGQFSWLDMIWKGTHLSIRSHIEDPHSSSVGGGNAPFCLFANCHKKPEEGGPTGFYVWVLKYIIFFFFFLHYSNTRHILTIIHLFFSVLIQCLKKEEQHHKKKVRVLI